MASEQQVTWAYGTHQSDNDILLQSCIRWAWTKREVLGHAESRAFWLQEVAENGPLKFSEFSSDR